MVSKKTNLKPSFIFFSFCFDNAKRMSVGECEALAIE